jgi:hypothetical protein
VLLVDYGRRRLTTMRILRPFIAAAVVMPFVAPGLDLRGRGLLLEAAGIAAGVLLGLLAAAAMRVERDPETSVPVTVAGVPYVGIWVVVALARLVFAYEAQHSASFARALGGFLVSNYIAAAALADSIMFLGFTMLIVQRGSLGVRAYRARPAPVLAGDSRTTDAPV